MQKILYVLNWYFIVSLKITVTEASIFISIFTIRAALLIKSEQMEAAVIWCWDLLFLGVGFFWRREYAITTPPQQFIEKFCRQNILLGILFIHEKYLPLEILTIWGKSNLVPSALASFNKEKSWFWTCVAFP